MFHVKHCKTISPVQIVSRETIPLLKEVITISIIYKSADTAETINRAIDNSMGTTTTSQGAASDGLIIKEDLKPIIQNVQTYLNPFVDKTIFGTPPLTFHSIQAVIDWSIWGNDDTGTYVGELSDNLFNKNNADVYESTNIVIADTQWNKYTGTGKTVRIPVSASTQYSVSIDSAIETSVFRVLAITSDDIPVVGTPVYGTVLVSTSADNTATFTTGTGVKYIIMQFTATVTDQAINTLMLCTGNTPKPYEPYGVNIPIKFNGNTYNTYISDYLRKSDGETPVYDVMMSDGTIIRAVNSDGTEKETPTTETYTAPVLTALWGYNAFDVDTTVTPANVIINYQDN